MEFFVVNEQQVLEVMEEEGRADEHAYRRARLRELRDASNPFEDSEFAFRGQYRLSRDLARMLIEQVRPFLTEKVHPSSVPVELRVLTAVHFYAHGSYQKSVGSSHHLGLSQPAVSNAISEVTAALNRNEMLGRHVAFPLTVAEREAIQTRNYRRCHIPGVLGFLDGTLIAIKRPVEREELFMCRKGYHAMNAQIVCTFDKQILNIVSRFNGSANDSYIWSNSSVREILQQCSNNGEQCWLLGDSGYPLEPWLHIPYVETAPESIEDNYNIHHKRARSVVERTIGLLKGRFRCLLKHRVLHYEPLKASHIINACCVLHNMCVRAYLEEEDLHVNEEDEDGRQDRDIVQAGGVVRGRHALRIEGERTRHAVAQRLRVEFKLLIVIYYFILY